MSDVHTFYDFITVAIFAGLIVLFLHRSVDIPPDGDRLWHYLVAAVGCAVANYLGNDGWTIFAVLMIVATLAFIQYVIKPFS